MKSIAFLPVLFLITLSAKPDCCGLSTVQVTGTGKVSGTPDTASFSVTATQTAPTTSEAAAAVNRDINALLSELAKLSVPKQDIRTSQLSLGPEYDYPNGTQVLKGQRASQSLIVKLRNITEDGSSVGKVLDALNAYNGTQISGLIFDISNKKSLEKEARIIAYNDARAKARQYAQLSEQRLGDPLTIDESGSSYNPSPYLRVAFDANSSGGGAQVPTGQIDVQVDVSIIWKLN